MALPTMVATARTVLEKGILIPGVISAPLVLPTFESNVIFMLRFMVDCKARQCWLETRSVVDIARAGDWWKLDRASSWRLATHEEAVVNLPGT